jgi:hypothetical protein
MIWLWFSPAGTAIGKPWWVKRAGEEAQRYARVVIRGETRTAFKDTGFDELPDGPRAVVIASGEVHAE